jgi:carboxylesterase type B
MESGATLELVATDFAAQGFDAVVLAGCNSTNQTQEASLGCLRSLSWEQLLDIQLKVAAARAPLANGQLGFLPTVDGSFLPAAPSQLYATGQVSKVPIILGWNHDDGTLFTSRTIQSEADVVTGLLKAFPGLSNSTIQRILSLYPSNEFQSPPTDNISIQFARAARITRDLLFTCQALHVGEHIYQGTENAVFMYELNQTALTATFASQGVTDLGISHSSDVPYVYDNVATFSNSSSDLDLGKQISSSWSSFASSGNPSSPSAQTIHGWTPAFASSSNSPELMVIGGGNSGMTGLGGPNMLIKQEQLKTRCAFVNSQEVKTELGT